MSLPAKAVNEQTTMEFEVAIAADASLESAAAGGVVQVG
jgi:hypothetical protein